MDTTPLASDLLRQRDFLLRLATGLVGGDDAEDLVQDVLVRAVEHPRSPGSGGRGWLARVARNLAANRFRARARRERRERDSARPEGSSAALGEVQERFELGQHLAAAVGALDEPYRAVILLRFFEGLTHAEIAARLGLPLATVRTRQQRALARLRDRLDRELGGREAWSVGLGTWLSRQGASTAVPAMSGVGLVAVVTAVVVLAGGAWWLRGARHEGEVWYQTQYGEIVRVPPPDDASAASGGEVVRGARLARAALLAGSRSLVVGRVLGLTAAEITEAHVEVDADWKRYALDPAPVRARLEDDGTFEVQVDELLASAHEPADELVVELDHALHLRASTRVPIPAGVCDASGTTRFDAGVLTARDAAVVRGAVLLPDGSPAAGAAVEAFYLEEGVPRMDSSAQATCAENGRFDVRLQRGGECALALLAEGVRPGIVVDTARIGRALELGPVVLESGQSILGRVTRLGSPMPLAQVSLRAVQRGRSLQRAQAARIAWVAGRFEWEGRRFEADSAGRFACGGLAAGEYELTAEGPLRTSSLGFEREAVRVVAPCADLEVEFRASLVTLERSPDSPPEITGKIRVARAGHEEAAFWFFRASDEPRTSFVAPPDTALSLRIELEGVPAIPLEIVTPGPGEELRRTIAFRSPEPLASFELEWLPEVGLALDALRVYFESPEGEARFDRGFYTSDAVEGVFRIDDLPPGSYRVRVHAGWDHFEFTPALDRVLLLEFSPGETRRERLVFELGGQLRVDIRAVSGERRGAQFRLLDASGDALPVLFQTKRENTWLSETWCFSPWAEHESESLPAGDYELVLWDDDVAEQRIPVHLAAGEVAELAVTLQPE